MTNDQRDRLMIEMHTALVAAEIPKRVGILEQKIAKIGVWISLVSAATIAAVAKAFGGGSK